MILHQRPLRTVYEILSLTNSTLLTGDNLLWFKIYSSQLMIFSIKNIISCSYRASLIHPNLLYTTQCNLHLVNSPSAAVSDPYVYIPCTKSHVLLQLLRSYQSVSPDPRQVHLFGYKANFYGEDLLAPCSNSKLEDHPLSSLHGCLFNVIAATLHTGRRNIFRYLKTPHVVLKGPELLEKQFKNN
jgi:hypothetical protein